MRATPHHRQDSLVGDRPGFFRTLQPVLEQLRRGFSAPDYRRISRKRMLTSLFTKPHSRPPRKKLIESVAPARRSQSRTWRRPSVSFLKKILGGKNSQSGERIRACSQCGMPVTEHKDWCSILNGQEGSQATAEVAK